MLPAPSDLRCLTEREYWHDYEIIKNDVHAAMVSCYTHRAINHVAATEMDILEKMNGSAEFWQVTSFSLQNTLFITLARILDSDRDVHSIHQVLNATLAHPEFFNHAALPASRTLKTDIDEILCFLHSLIKSVWSMAF